MFFSHKTQPEQVDESDVRFAINPIAKFKYLPKVSNESLSQTSYALKEWTIIDGDLYIAFGLMNSGYKFFVHEDDIIEIVSCSNR